MNDILDTVEIKMSMFELSGLGKIDAERKKPRTLLVTLQVGWVICSGISSARRLHQCSVCLAVFLGILSGLALKNQVQDSLACELVASGNWWAFFQAKIPAFSAVSED